MKHSHKDNKHQKKKGHGGGPAQEHRPMKGQPVKPADPMAPFLYMRTAVGRASSKELEFLPEPDKRRTYTGLLKNAFDATEPAQRGKILDSLAEQFPKSPFPFARVAFFCASTKDLLKGKQNLDKALSLAAQHNIDPNELERLLQSTIKREP